MAEVVERLQRPRKKATSFISEVAPWQSSFRAFFPRRRPVLTQAILKPSNADPQLFCGPGPAAVVQFQHRFDQLALDLTQLHRLCPGASSAYQCPPDARKRDLRLNVQTILQA
jgi:hypothetical protein